MADARLSANSDEAITDGTPERRLSGISGEALTTNDTVPERRLSAIGAESLTVAETIPERRMNAITLEVLVPARLTFVGWGVPIKSSIWN